MADANPPLLPKKSDKSVLIVLLVSLIIAVVLSTGIYFGFKRIAQSIIQSMTQSINSCYNGNTCRNQGIEANNVNNDFLPSSSTNTEIKRCRPNMHLENGSCFINVKPCQIENGFGRTTWTGQGWGPCLVNACQNGYKISGNACILKVTSQGAACTETDEGIDYYNKGVATVGSSTGWDFCDSIDGYLVERYCDGNNIEQVSFWCPNGCKDGACIQ